MHYIYASSLLARGSHMILFKQTISYDSGAYTYKRDDVFNRCITILLDKDGLNYLVMYK